MVSLALDWNAETRLSLSDAKRPSKIEKIDVGHFE
jgi:hypothetical protein